MAAQITKAEATRVTILERQDGAPRATAGHDVLLPKADLPAQRPGRQSQSPIVGMHDLSVPSCAYSRLIAKGRRAMIGG